VVGVGNEGDRHPRMDGLLCGAQVAKLPAGPGGEDERERDGQREGESNGQYALPGSSHKFNIAGSALRHSGGNGREIYAAALRERGAPRRRA